MKFRSTISGGFAAIVLAALIGCHPRPMAVSYQPAEGDVVFQSLPHGELVDAIEGITKSSFSHCGMVARRGTEWTVIEAIEPVKELGEWISQGRGGRISVYRLNANYADKIPEMITSARSRLGVPYDYHYQFDDEHLYCSELVFKAFRQSTGEDLGKLKKLGDLNWQPFEKFIRHMENGSLPLEREMITPADLAEASQLHLIYGPPAR